MSPPTPGGDSARRRGPRPKRTLRRILVAVAATVLGVAGAAATGLSSYRAQMWDQALLQIPDAAEAVDELGSAVAAGDFNGDGFADLAIGIPSEGLPGGEGPVDAAGAVVVVYGRSGGLAVAGAQAWTQDSPGIADAVEADDRFGWAVASGDFDGDAYDDLAIGAYTESLPGAASTGVVHVLRGGAAGLSSAGSQLWSLADPFVEGSAEGGEGFGFALASGDFDGDGYADLAIGSPNDGSGALGPVGGINILYGGDAGLDAAGNQQWYATEVSAAYESGCRFGEALAVGDFDGDGYADLAVGAPLDDFLDLVSVGSARVLYGSAGGLATAGSFYFLGPQAVGWQGRALAAGDLDGDGRDDLAIGIPGRTVSGQQRAGAVAVRLGTDGGFLDGGEWSQDTAGVLGVAEVDDRFGSALATGDFDRDGYADLVVGVPSEMFVDAGDGVVHLLRGSAAGPTATDDQLWTRAAIAVPDPSAGNGGDHLGSALAVGDFDGTGHPDLALGVPGESLDVGGNPGAVLVLYGFLFADGFEGGDGGAWSLVAP